MAKTRDQHRAELAELHAGLTAQQAEGPAPAQPGRPHRPEWAEDLDQLSAELRARLNEVKEDAEEIVSAHPLATLAATFLLGVVIGRMMGRHR